MSRISKTLLELFWWPHNAHSIKIKINHRIPTQNPTCIRNNLCYFLLFKKSTQKYSRSKEIIASKKPTKDSYHSLSSYLCLIQIYYFHLINSIHLLIFIFNYYLKNLLYFLKIIVLCF